MAMQVDYSRDKGDQFASLNAALEAGEGEIRMRIQPNLFSTANSGKRLYLGWRGVYWNLRCESRQDAVDVRDAMELFFRQIETYGVGAVKSWLDKIDLLAVQSLAQQTQAGVSADGDDGAGASN